MVKLLTRRVALALFAPFAIALLTAPFALAAHSPRQHSGHAAQHRRAHHGVRAHRGPHNGNGRSGAARKPAGATPQIAAPRGATTTLTAPTLLGDSAVESTRDYVTAGQSEAFRFRALAYGSTGAVHVYVDAHNAAGLLVVGLYSDANGHPGSLFAGGSLFAPAASSWNTIPIPSTQIVAGASYWIAVLGEGGTLRYRDRQRGPCTSETSASSRLGSLPATWRTGHVYSDCPISGYVTASLVPQAPTPPPPAPESPAPAPAPAPESPAPPPAPESPAPAPESPAPPPAPTPPANTALPTVAGTAIEASTLSASSGSWTGSPTGYAYQWQDCNSSGTTCANVNGATATNYTLTATDVGHTLRVVVTATNEGGSASASSLPTAVVTALPPPPPPPPPAAPTNTALPTIAGTTTEASALTATSGSWSGSPTGYAYQWQDCNSSGTACANVNGATSTNYTLTATDVGHTLRVVVTATNAGGSTQATSLPSAVVAALPPPPPPPPPAAPTNTALPTIAGTVAVEGTLSASTGSWSGSPTGYAYQWQDCNSSGSSCTNVNGATTATYKLVAGDVGHTLRVLVTATNAGGSAAASSVQTSVVPGASGGLFISPAGSDSSPCTQIQPCQTMSRAYHLATPGQTVQMLAGSYPAQAIAADSSKTSSADVVFMPAEGASVQVTGTINVFASHLTIENIATRDVVMGNYDQTAGRPDPTDITLQNLTGRNFEIDSTTNVTVEGGSWGPASACGGPNGGNNNSIRQPTSTAPANILIDNTVIHDVQSYKLVDCHIEGLAIFAGNGVTVSNTKFYGNSVYDVFMQANSGGHPNNITLTNNWFATAVDNSGANGKAVGSGNGIAVGNELSANVTLEGNHFNDVLNLNDAGDISHFTNVHVHGNVGIQPYNNYPCGSLSGVEWSQNVWQNDTCGSGDANLKGAAMPYMRATNDSTLNYTLTGSYAGWPGGGEPTKEPTVEKTPVEEPPAKEPPVEEPPVEKAPVEEPPAEEATTASVFLSPSGSDSAACSQAAPCRTLARGYSVAKPGQTVQLAEGTYADTSLPVDNTKASSSSNVVFTAAPGTTPAFSAGTLHLQAAHVELKGLKFRTLWVDASAQSDIMRNDTYMNFKVISSGSQAPANISFIGGSAGPAENENNIIGSNGPETTASPTNILIQGVHIHDYKLIPGSGAHVDCLQVWAAKGLTVEDSTFNDCEVFDIFVQFLPGGSAGTPSNVTIQNNFLDCCRTGYYSIMLPYHTGATGGSHFTNVTIRNNSTDKAITADPDATYTNVNIDGNIGPSLVFYSNASGNLTGKPAGIGADYNDWYSGTKIGTHDQTAPSGFTNLASLDFHLTSTAAAIGHGDPNDYPATDIDGNPRPNPPDAGADQYTGG